MRPFARILTLAIVATSIITATGCSKKTKPEENTSATGPSADANTLGDSDSGKAMGLQTVYFGYDSALLDAKGKATLTANAAILKANASLAVQIEGHTDARGGIQYNIALGERRANAARAFLIDQGIAEGRITTISYGKERPVDPAETEAAYAKNRRGNFAITSR